MHEIKCLLANTRRSLIANSELMWTPHPCLLVAIRLALQYTTDERKSVCRSWWLIVKEACGLACSVFINQVSDHHVGLVKLGQILLHSESKEKVMCSCIG